MSIFARARQALLEILYPEGAVCLGCGRISDGECLCPACRQELDCGSMLEAWSTRDLDGVPAWSARPHTGLPRKLVLELKHHAAGCAADALAGMLRTRPAAFPEPEAGTVVTWVPGPKSRIRERMTDHGRLLAGAAARELGLPCRQLLRRRGNDRPQASLREAERLKNLRKAFEPAGPVTFPVLLVDDVLTTGTTTRRCIAALRAAGAERITVLTMTCAARRKGAVHGHAGRL